MHAIRVKPHLFLTWNWHPFVSILYQPSPEPMWTQVYVTIGRNLGHMAIYVANPSQMLSVRTHSIPHSNNGNTLFFFRNNGVHSEVSTSSYFTARPVFVWKIKCNPFGAGALSLWLLADDPFEWLTGCGGRNKLVRITVKSNPYTRSSKN